MVLIDHSQAMNPHARRVNSLVADLARYGIALERWSRRRHRAAVGAAVRPPIALAICSRRRERSPALIISAGFEVGAALQSPDRSWLRALQRGAAASG